MSLCRCPRSIRRRALYAILAAFQVGSLTFAVSVLWLGAALTFPLAARIFVSGTVGGLFLVSALELRTQENAS